MALSITRKHGLNKCYDCATELRQVLIGAGKKGFILKLAAKGGRGYIIMKDADLKLPFPTHGNESISRTGQHFGASVGGLVFDNGHRTGIAREAWQQTFDCDVHNFERSEVEPF